jgi:hypothetical protein
MTWNWPSMADKTLGPALNGPMKRLENELASKALPTHDVVRTTDATVTTLKSYAVPVDTSFLVTGYVVARRTGGSAGAANDGAGYRVEFIAKNSAGTATAIGNSVTAIGESQAGLDVTVNASGADVRVRVTGAANNNISWAWHGRALSIKE